MSSDSSYKQFINRSEALEKISSGSKKLLRYSLPLLGISFSSSESKAQFSNLEVGRALNYLLQVEFMQELFYVFGQTRGDFFRNEIFEQLVRIKRQQQSHVVLIKNSLFTLDIEPAPQLSFDFTADGQFQPFSDYSDFLALAQIIEDMAVGVYKEQVKLLHQNNADPKLIRLIMRAQSTEARHSTFIRILRKKEGVEPLQHWLSAQDHQTLPEEVVNIYQAENNVNHGNTNVPSITTVSEEAVAEGWDEPIDRGLANNIFELLGARF